MNTSEIRKEAFALLTSAETSLTDGNVEQFERQIADAQSKMADADKIDQAQSQLKTLKGDFNKPLNSVPVADKDVAVYDPHDSTSRTKASYKPASWVKGLPAMAQPLWVQEKMGVTEKEQAEFQTDTFVKWMRFYRISIFLKSRI